MIPTFPEFKKLEFSDRQEITALVQKYPPYSDYNFTSLYCWNTEEKMELSILNGNLVIKFSDYASPIIFLSFLGTNQTEDTAFQLIEFAKKGGIESYLKLVPELVAEQVNNSRLEVNEDRNNFDYVYSIGKLVSYPGYDYSQQRKMMNRFVKRYENIKVIPLDLDYHRNSIENLMATWEKNKDFDHYDEKKVFKRMFEKSEQLPLINIGILINDSLVAFSINEIINQDFAISHFANADIQYTGIYSYLMRETANILSFQGCKLINCEQDLGIEGLRKAKGSYRPELFLKKYIIKLSS
jgi:hypothetical protein